MGWEGADPSSGSFGVSISIIYGDEFPIDPPETVHFRFGWNFPVISLAPVNKVDLVELIACHRFSSPHHYQPPSGDSPQHGTKLGAWEVFPPLTLLHVREQSLEEVSPLVTELREL